jgi:hypothetical protein
LYPREFRTVYEGGLRGANSVDRAAIGVERETPSDRRGVPFQDFNSVYEELGVDGRCRSVQIT